jgi:hypothetical protein
MIGNVCIRCNSLPRSFPIALKPVIVVTEGTVFRIIVPQRRLISFANPNGLTTKRQ